jgi:hypothetical protein
MNLNEIVKRIFNLDFFLSVVIPIIIFYVLSHFNMILLGTILAGSWALAAIIFQYTKERVVYHYTVDVFMINFQC